MNGRPKPKILLATPDPTNRDIEIQIVPVGSYYIVLYDGAPVNIIHLNRSQSLWNNTRRYIKTGYPYRGHADRHAAKLNRIFNTDKFTIKEIK